jgi:hypothetical protein
MVFAKFSKVFPLIPDNNNQKFKGIITHHGFGMTHMLGCVGETANFENSGALYANCDDT